MRQKSMNHNNLTELTKKVSLLISELEKLRQEKQQLLEKNQQASEKIRQLIINLKSLPKEN